MDIGKIIKEYGNKRDEIAVLHSMERLATYIKDTLSEEEYEKRCEERRGSKNGMFGRYGVSPRSVRVKCVETGEIFVSISDAERKKDIVGVKDASKIGGLAGGYHWERITNS